MGSQWSASVLLSDMLMVLYYSARVANLVPISMYSVDLIKKTFEWELSICIEMLSLPCRCKLCYYKCEGSGSRDSEPCYY